MTQTFIAFDGNAYPVREGFAIWPQRFSAYEEAEAIAAWRAQPPADKPWMRQFLTPVTERQREYLDCWTRRNNMNSALAYLQGRDFRDFGFETLCQVHGNLWHFECGCKMHVLFDHHKRESLVDDDFRHLRNDHVCEEHRGANDFTGHLNMIRADGRKRVKHEH